MTERLRCAVVIRSRWEGPSDMDISTFKMPEKKMERHIHSELHEVVAILRREFGETAKSGVGSFGFYLRLLKKIPVSSLRLWLASIRDSPKLDTQEARRKVFWWTYAQQTKKPS